MFNNDQDIAQHVQLVLSLDPLAGISEDDKMSRLANNGITQLDYVVSSNINKFVSEAIEQNKGFADMDITKQKEIIYTKAKEQIATEVTSLIPADEVPNNG
jgi:hypothetical protein